ncbi:cupin domain-containing protein [Nocardiopsis composta]
MLDDLLSGTRARGGVFNLTILDPPWGFDIVDGAPLALATLLSGSGWVMRPGEAPVRMGERDVAVLSGSEPYVVADSPGSRPNLRIHPGGVCEPLPGAPADHSTRLGTRTHGGRPDGRVRVVSGSYPFVGDVGRRLLGALRPTVVVPAAEVGPVMDLALDEIRRDRLGQQSVLDRWLDLALITTVRAWFDRQQEHAPGGTGPSTTRSSAGRCGSSTTTRRIRGRSPRWRARPASPGPRCPAGSPTPSASRR